MTEPKQSDARSGIAIIIVLGVLAVLMVLAVAFAVSMRTESAAAGYYIEIAKSRAMVHTALARALADLDQDLASLPDGASYPSRWSQEAMPSGMANAANLYVGEATQLLPSGIYKTAAKLPSPGINTGSGQSVEDKNAAWNPGGLAGFGIKSIGGAEGIVQDNAEKTLTASVSVGGTYRLFAPAVPLWSRVENGRIAYLIVNLSGLLDAQFVGDENTPRGAGSSLAEIDVSRLSDKPDMATLEAARAQPFESLYELVQYGGFSFPPTNWSAYSRYPAEINGALPAVVGGSIADLRGRGTEIKAAFVRAMALAGDTLQADMLYANLLDYVDEDNIPGGGLVGDGTQGPYVEAVPMVNEVFATNRMTITAGGNIAGSFLFVSIETFYPFVSPPTNGNFQITYDIRPDSPPGMPTITPLIGSFPKTLSLAPSPEGYFPITERFSVTGTNVPAGIRYTVEIDAEIRDGGMPVDRIPTISLSMQVPPLLPGETGGAGAGHDVIDPRINWAAVHWANNTPFTYTPTVGRINTNAVRFMAINAPNLDTDAVQRDTGMYVANRPLLSVGELGCLFAPGGATTLRYLFNPNGTPLMGAAGPWLWRTVRLYDHGGGEWDRVLDHLTLSNAVTTAHGKVYMGPVNPNSEVRDALAAVFYNMGRNDRYYGDPSPLATKLSNWNTGARPLADRIQDYTYNAPFEWLSDMGRRACATNIFAELGVLAGSELQKEAFYRNCASLMHTRQNLFLILLAGQTANDPSTFGPPFGVPRTDQRALAVVWRDPVPNAAGRHPCFVRWFTWLEK